jgi:hypothetical protein
VSLTIRGAANIVDHAPQGCFALLERAAPQVATVHGADASTNEPITAARRPFSSPSRALSGQLGHGRRPAVGCEIFPILYRRHRFPPRRFSMRFGSTCASPGAEESAVTMVHDIRQEFDFHH